MWFVILFLMKINNQFQLSGRIGKTSLYNADKKYIRFSIAVNDFYTDKNGERIQTTDWFNCVAFGPVAKRLEIFAVKGTKLVLQGRLHSDSFTDADEVKRYSVNLYVNEFLVLQRAQELA